MPHTRCQHTRECHHPLCGCMAENEEEKLAKGAFPTITGMRMIGEHEAAIDGDPGMDLRDWFAGQALAGMVAGSQGLAITTEQFAQQSYRLADAMLAVSVGSVEDEALVAGLREHIQAMPECSYDTMARSIIAFLKERRP